MTKYFTKENLLSENAIIAYFVLIKIIITLYPYQYGIFRDVFLYISMSEHLGLGYLEVPPISPFVLAIVRYFVDTSYFSMHIIQAILGSAFIIITALMAKKMGGGKIAVLITLACTTFAPQYIGSDANFDYNTFNRLFWALALYSILLLLASENRKYWIYFGIAAGFGLLSKITMLYLGFGLFLAFLAARDRKYLFDKRFIFGGLIALAIFLPFILWQAYYGFPIIEYLANYKTKLYQASPLEYFTSQIINMNLFSILVWIPGLYYFLFNKEGKKYRVFGLGYIIIAAIFVIQKAKYYLIDPYYSVLFAGGAVYLTGIIEKYKMEWLKQPLIYSVIICGVVSIPLARPILPPEVYIKYSRAIGIGNGVSKGEIYKTSDLPQYFADQFGWEEMAQKVAGVYQSLSNEDKKKACIYARNYGEAGALHYYRQKYGYPDPICSHNIFYFWGPGNYTGEIVIVVGIYEKDKDTLVQNFDSVTEADRIYNKYAMPQENNPVYLCKGLHGNLKEFWKKIKLFI